MKLSDLDKDKMQEAFKVPELYFENLPELISKRVNEKKSFKIINFRPWLVAASVAASIAIIATIYIQNPTKQNKSNIEIALNKHEILEVITNDNDLYDITDELIYEEMSKTSNKNETQKQISDEDIIEYLIEEDPYNTDN